MHVAITSRGATNASVPSGATGASVTSGGLSRPAFLDLAGKYKLPACQNNPEQTACATNPAKNCRGDLSMIWTVGVAEASSLKTLMNQAKTSSRAVFSGKHVRDVKAVATADPFLIRDVLLPSRWYMFTEVVDNDCQKGVVALTVSHDDLKTFEYVQVVLHEPFHVSFPMIVQEPSEEGGGFYMTVSATAGTTGPNVLWLYKAEAFPFGWKKAVQILKPGQLDGRAVDPVLLQHKGTWWIFTNDDGVGYERLFFADSLKGPYTEHPRSKTYNFRQSGRIAEEGGVLWAFNHDQFLVLARPILTLNRTHFEYGGDGSAASPLAWPLQRGETSLFFSPSIGAVTGAVGAPRYNTAWAPSGMHHFSAVRAGEGRWVAVVDGWREDMGLAVHSCLNRGGSGAVCHV